MTDKLKLKLKRVEFLRQTARTYYWFYLETGFAVYKVLAYRAATRFKAERRLLRKSLQVVVLDNTARTVTMSMAELRLVS